MSVRSCSVKSFDTSSPRRLWPRIRLTSDDAEQKAAANKSVEGRETLTLKGHSSGVTSVSFSPDGKRIVSGSGDKTLKVWDISPLDTSKQLSSLLTHRRGHENRTLGEDRRRDHDPRGRNVALPRHHHFEGSFRSKPNRPRPFALTMAK